MLFSYDWLNEYVDPLPEPGELAEKLTMTGTEIEGLTRTVPELENVITARVESVDKHPNADRLSLCSVETGSGSRPIVCGAKNMKPGDIVVLALPGAVLPGDFKIKKSKIRGEVSEGMMCSEVELGLAEESAGIMILPPDTPVGVEINEALPTDWIFEAGITPNRPDTLSIRGIAREVGAVTGARFDDKIFTVSETGPAVDTLATVAVEAPEKCGRYSARVIKGVKVGPSPGHIARRLESHGIRSVNNVVDVTNYVLLELGSPLHAFDMDKLSGASIIVRDSAPGEEIKTIDDKTRTLDEGTLVIADPSGPVALAGVMGGKDTEVGDDTVDVLLEAAWFEPTVVRRSSKTAGLSTDSSYRFERGVDVEGTVRALDMAASMILELAGGEAAAGVIDIYPEPFEPAPVELRVTRAEELLGVPLTEGEVKEILAGLAIGTASKAEPDREGVVTAYPPSFRPDLKTEVDLVEEVARVIGYDKIPTTLPAASIIPGTAGKLSRVRGTIRECLSSHGFHEVINYSFVSPSLYEVLSPDGGESAGVRIVNPLSEDQVVMRASLIPSLLDNLRTNLQQRAADVNLFEVSTVFLSSEGERLPREGWRASAVMYGHRFPPAWNRPSEMVDFFDIKGAVEMVVEAAGAEGSSEFATLDDLHSTFHPGKSAKLLIDGVEAGILGELHPDLASDFDLRHPAFAFELDMDIITGAAATLKHYTRLPRFPGSERDLAFVVDDTVPYGEIVSSIEKLDTKLIERIELFDVYYGGNIPTGKRSLALRIYLRAPERTLKQKEIDSAVSHVAGELAERFGAEIRTE